MGRKRGPGKIPPKVTILPVEKNQPNKNKIISRKNITAVILEVVLWGGGDVLGHFSPYFKIAAWLLAILVLVFMYVPTWLPNYWLKWTLIGIVVIACIMSYNPLVKLIKPPETVIYKTSLFPTFVDANQQITLILGGATTEKTGGNLAYSLTWKDLMGASVMPFYVNREKIPFEIYVKDNRLFVNVSIYIKENETMQLEGYTLINRPTNWDFNTNGTSLEVVNEKGIPVFQFIYRSPFEILVNGIFPLESGNGVIVASPAGTYLGGEYLMSYNAIPIFKYPSSKYPNELR